jgi:hypothetical protein
MFDRHRLLLRFAGPLAVFATLTTTSVATATAGPRSATIQLNRKQLGRKQVLTNADRSVTLKPTLLNRLSRGRRGHVVATTRVGSEKVHRMTFKMRRPFGGRSGAELYAQHQLGAGATGYAPLSGAEATWLGDEILQVAGLGMIARPTLVFTGFTAFMTGITLAGQVAEPTADVAGIAMLLAMHVASVWTTFAAAPAANTDEPRFLDANSKKALGPRRELIDHRTVPPYRGGGA